MKWKFAVLLTLVASATGAWAQADCGCPDLYTGSTSQAVSNGLIRTDQTGPVVIEVGFVLRNVPSIASQITTMRSFFGDAGSRLRQAAERLREVNIEDGKPAKAGPRAKARLQDVERLRRKVNDSADEATTVASQVSRMVGSKGSIDLAKYNAASKAARALVTSLLEALEEIEKLPDGGADGQTKQELIASIDRIVTELESLFPALTTVSNAANTSG